MDDKYRSRLIQLTQDLVDIPTINLPPHGDEKAGQEYVKNCMRQLSMEIMEYSPEQAPNFNDNPAFIKGQDYTDRRNVMGTWKGSGGGRSIILNGHMDVVTDEPYLWTKCQPFKSIAEGGRIYGRGTADMKGGLACALVALEMLRDEGFHPKGDIIFESVVDEEYASSAGSIAARQLGYNADYAVLLEPTGLAICPATVGSVVAKVTVQGVAGMPYTGKPAVNPAYMLGEVIDLIRQYEHRRTETVKSPKLWNDTPQGAQIVVTKAKSGDLREHGQLSTPEDAWVELVIQVYPDEDMQQVFDGFCDFMEDAFSQPDKIKTELEYHFCRAADSSPSDGLAILQKHAADHVDDLKTYGAMFSCDLFAFTLYGDMPAAVFGPFGGSLHGPDEWVDIESMEKAAMTLHDFLLEWCG